MISELNPDIPTNEKYDDLLKEFSDEIGVLQRKAYQLNIPIIVIFEGWYDIFVGEIINRQLLPLDPRGFDYYFTDSPTSEENKNPFLTRFFQKIPPKGKISIFDRSWYMRGLIEYLLNDKNSCLCANSVKKTNFSAVMTETVDKDVIYTEKFHDLINTLNLFEKTLTDNGVRIIKIYFGARKEKRIESRKMWQKIVPYNIDKRSVEKIYKKDISVLKEMIEQTNTPNAPWNLYFVKEDIELSTLQTMKILIDQMKALISTREHELSCPCPIPENSSCQLEVIPDHLNTADLTKSYSKKEYKKKLKKCQKELFYAHYLLHLKSKPMVLVFEGWDAAGKGGGIKRIAQAMNPRYYRVIPIGTPTDVDLKYHYLWRFMNGVPSCGKTSVFDRSWYGRVLVERIEKLNTEEEWKRAYQEINGFERAMTNSGVIIIKFWMQISKDKQYDRFKARSENPLKQWKLTDEDWRNREKWDEYYDAVNEMIEKTSTEKAPWVIIESNDKYYARIKILRTVVNRIKEELGEEIKEINLPE